MRINWAIKQTYKIPTRFIRWSHSSSDKNPLYKKALLSLRKKKNHGNNLKLKKKEFTDKKKWKRWGKKNLGFQESWVTRVGSNTLFFCNLNIKTRKRKHKSNKLHKERKSTHQGEKYIFLWGCNRMEEQEKRGKLTSIEQRQSATKNRHSISQEFFFLSQWIIVVRKGFKKNKEGRFFYFFGVRNWIEREDLLPVFK